MSRYSPITPALLAGKLAALLLERHSDRHPLRVALDAPDFVELAVLIDSIGAGIRAAGRPFAVLAAGGFYRDASLRLEYGKTDVQSFYAGWLDSTALQREVLLPLADNRSYLPELRDPLTNRSSRSAPVAVPSSAVLLVTGALLLGAGPDLDFDVLIHASLSRAARRRLVPADLEWTLPAYDRYDLDVDPAARADAVFRYDDPDHPALLIRATRRS